MRLDGARSAADAGARLEWRPSRWLVAALALLGALAAVSVLASALPAAVARPAAVVSIVAGLWLARGEARKPRLQLRLLGSGVVEVDGDRVEDFHVTWRGPLAFVGWRRSGRRHRHAWWPDALAPTARRELRLAAPVESAARGAPSMAP